MADAKKSSIQKKSGCYLMNIKQPERTNKRLKLSFQRMAASITTLKSEHKISAAVGLVDLSETGAGFFTSELLSKGCGVEIIITDPMLLKVRALVAWSIPIESGIAGSRFPCRSGLQFVYDNDMQRQAVRDFLERLAANPIDNYRRTFSEPATGVAPVAAAEAPVVAAADPAALPILAAVLAPETAPVSEVAAAPSADATKPENGEGGGQSQAA